MNQHKLTKREREVYHHLCIGLQDREISLMLKISLETIKKHNKNIYLKLGARNRVEAVLLRGTIQF
jgi:LuxR family maltose regulon positive regulatory protein